MAGVTLLAIAVPEQLATARLAGMPPITGFYAFVAGTVLFALLGSNPQISVGADSTIAPLFAVGIAHLASTGSPAYIALVSLLAVVVGVLVVLVGLLRLGWIAEFLSAPIISGFLAGVAVIIIVHQLTDLFGLRPTSGSTVHRVIDVARHVGSTNGWTLGIGLAVFAVVLTAERINERVPGALVGARRIDGGGGDRRPPRPRCRRPRHAGPRCTARRPHPPLVVIARPCPARRRRGGPGGGEPVGRHHQRLRLPGWIRRRRGPRLHRRRRRQRRLRSRRFLRRQRQPRPHRRGGLDRGPDAGGRARCRRR